MVRILELIIWTVALLACFNLWAASGAGASEFTFTGEDTRTGQPVEVLSPRYQCAADRAADAGSRAGIDVQAAIGRAVTGDPLFDHWAW